ncbi:MAG: cation transporter, partial [Candidatus Aminicenantes bacterium]|nr:cation transporter [Candidatus Aminicenantes bacterium]
MKHEPIVNGFLPPETSDFDQHENKGQTVVNLGLIWNIILAAGKTAMGIAGHSTALLSDGINSTSDVAYYIVVKIFMKMAGRPPDPEHPYG